VQVGYAEKISNVWAKVAEDARGYAGRSTDASPSGLSSMPT